MGTLNSRTLQGGSTSFVQPNVASGSRTQPTKNSLSVVQPVSTGSIQANVGAATNQTPVSSPAIGSRTTANVSPDTNVAIDPAAVAAKAAAAAEAARAGALRGNITDLVNSIKSLLGSRYGEIDSAAQEQAAKLDSRFNKESGDITQQATDNTNEAAGSFAGRGTRDSSDYGNTVDKITGDANSQIQDLGTGLAEDKANVGAAVLKGKAGLDAQRQSYDTVVSHLAEETNPDNLISLRNTIDSKLTELKAGGADNSTDVASRSALEAVAPSNARAQQLKTTLAKIVGGSAPAAQKASVGQALITAAGVSADDAQKLLQGFQADLGAADPNKQQVQPQQ